MKKIVSRVLLIFVLFSIAFLGYKEFVQGEHEKENQKTGVAVQKPVNQITDSVDASQGVAPAPKNEAVPPSAAVQPPKSKVIAYYFHGTFRCTTCQTIEQYSKEAIEHYFPNELRSGKLEFKPLNVEEGQNRHFIQDYQLFSKSLVISLVKDGREVKWKNLADVWKHVRNKDNFFQYVKDEVDIFLKET